jgi:hypothetical protein
MRHKKITDSTKVLSQCALKFQVGDHSTGAGNEIRTRDTKLGKLVLYQLSYARSDKMVKYYKNMFLSIRLMISIDFNDS